jgi:hypothetical protein
MNESFAGLIGRVGLRLCQAPILFFAAGDETAALRTVVRGNGDSLVTPRSVTQQRAPRRSVCLNIKDLGRHDTLLCKIQEISSTTDAYGFPCVDVRGIMKTVILSVRSHDQAMADIKKALCGAGPVTFRKAAQLVGRMSKPFTPTQLR